MLKTALVLTLGMSLAPIALAASLADGFLKKNSKFGNDDDEWQAVSYGSNKNAKPNFPNNGNLISNAKAAKKFCRENPNAKRCDDDGNYSSTQKDKLEYLEKIAAKNGNVIKVSPSKPANSAAAVQQVNVDGTLYPVCSSNAVDPEGDNWGWENDRTCVFTYSTCSSAATDVDGDGWGWENNKSCVVR